MPTGAQAPASPVRPRRSRIKSSPSVLYPFLSVKFARIAVLLLLLVVSSSSSSCHAQGVEPNESELLWKFKSGLTNSDPALADWNASPNPCDGNSRRWTGVLCLNGHVYGLQMENMNLGGRIDVDSLVPLRFLRTVSLMNNNFEGSMPDWRKLGALKGLFLSNNKFSGDIPADAFRNMTSMKKVHMADNRFTGSIPASLESPKLIELRLENNQFAGQIPEIWSDQLKIFNVSNNQLHGPIPVVLQKLDPSSFIGNQELWGKPLETSCPENDQSSALPADVNKPSPVEIALIVICVVLGLILVILLAITFLRGRRREPTPRVGMAVPPPHGTNAVNETSSTVPVAAVSFATGVRKKVQQQAGKLTFVRDTDGKKFEMQDLMRGSAQVLARGTFGASYKVVLLDGEAVVVKRLKMNEVAREDFHEHMRRLGRLRHPNLLPLVAFMYRKEEKFLLFDYVSNGSLATCLHGKPWEGQSALSWAIRLKIIKGVVKGLRYLHNELPSLTLPHGHLKLSNVLLDHDFNPLLMDYTLGPVVNPNQVHQILVAYQSPDYTKDFRISRKSDVWCLGVLILEILTSKFRNGQEAAADLAGWIRAIVQEVSGNEAEAFDKDMKVTSEKCRPEMVKLLRIGMACCEEDVDKRLDMGEAVKQIEEIQESSAP